MALLSRYLLFLISLFYNVDRMTARHVFHLSTLTQTVFFLTLLGGPVTIHAPFVKIAPGVIFHTEIIQTQAGPEFVSLLNVDLTAPNVQIGLVQAHDRLISSDETVSSMANRSGAVAGVNGDYFEIGTSGRPIGMVETNGQLIQSPTVYAVLEETSSKQLVTGFEKFVASVTDGSASFKLSSINHFVEASEGKLVLATSALGAPVSIPGDTVAFLQPIAGSSTAFVVTSIQPYVTKLPALVGQDALWGAGLGGRWLTATLHKGDHVNLSESLVPDIHAVNAIGGGPILIMNGSLYNDPNSPVPGEANYRYPLTAISISKDGAHVLFAVFDGRYLDPTRSPGLTHAQAAQYLLAHGAYQAILLDSGGSSEMVARFSGHHSVSVTNWPSDGKERPVANGLFIYNK